MTKIKSVLVYSIEFLLIICFTTSTAFGVNSNDSKSVQPDNYLSSEVSNVNFDYYNYFFGLNSYGNNVITRFGKLPVLETADQKESWNTTLEELSNKIKDTVASKYMYPHGEVVTCGANAKGYFVILFKYGDVDEPLMNEIYTLISNSAKEMGIQDIPIEFGYGTYMEEITLDSEKGIYHEFGESTENLSESDVHTIQELMKTKPTSSVESIAAYGRIPLLKDQEEIISWGDKLFALHSGTQEKINPYMEKDEVIVYAVETTRLHVGINETLPSKEKTTIIKEIYRVIDKEARKQNITDVPVYFDEGTFINHTVTGDLGVVKNSSYNNSELNNEKVSNLNDSSENKPSKTNSIPGFGLLGSLICLCGRWKLRKK